MLDKMMDWADAPSAIIPEIDGEAVRTREKLDELSWVNEKQMDIFSKLPPLIYHDLEEALKELR